MKINQLFRALPDAQITDMISSEITFAEDWMKHQQLREYPNVPVLPYAADHLYQSVHSLIIQVDNEIEHTDRDTNYPVVGIIFEDVSINRFYSVSVSDIQPLNCMDNI